MSKKFKPCPFCDKKQIDKIIEIIKVIMKYKDDVLFLRNFFLGDWTNQPLEVKQLIKKSSLGE